MLELYYSLSSSTRGVILLGPSGCGKSTLLRLLCWTLNLLHQSPSADARSHAPAPAAQANATQSYSRMQSQMQMQQRSRFSVGRSPASANVSPVHNRPDSISKYSVSSFDTSHSTTLESVRV